MGKNIFISYKYGDTEVKPLRTFREELLFSTKVRDYVDTVQGFLSYEDHINLGEKDGEDLSAFKDSTIESGLRNKIFRSSITLVMISPNMKTFEPETDQWIPWEVSYSLKEHSRDGRISQTNAVLAVVLPDKNGSYEYYIKQNVCTNCSCRTLQTDRLFNILRTNMFNIKTPEYLNCTHLVPKTIYKGDSCYIDSVKWDDFSNNIGIYLDKAIRINEQIANYNICKVVE